MKTAILLICLTLNSCSLLKPQGKTVEVQSPIDLMIQSQISQLSQQISL